MEKLGAMLMNLKIWPRTAARGRHWRTIGRGASCGVIAALSLAACATTPPTELANLSSTQVEAINQICGPALGAHQGDSYFLACRSSLAASVKDEETGKQLVATQKRCTARGLTHGSPALALCVLDEKAVAAAPRTAKRVQILQASTSIVVASNDEIHRRAQRSCAMLGFDPAYPAFASCVSNLQSSLDQANSTIN